MAWYGRRTMQVGDRVRLITFNGTKRWNSKGKIYEPENYWELIGETGTVVQDPTEKSVYASFSKEPRVCIRFDNSVTDRDLICHNPVPNSLWLRVTDLEVIQTAGDYERG